MLALCGHMKGEFKENKFHGEGTYKWDDGATYKGMWRENKMHGKGCYIDPEEVKWEGQFYNVSSAPALEPLACLAYVAQCRQCKNPDVHHVGVVPVLRRSFVPQLLELAKQPAPRPPLAPQPAR